MGERSWLSGEINSQSRTIKKYSIQYRKLACIHQQATTIIHPRYLVLGQTSWSFKITIVVWVAVWGVRGPSVLQQANELIIKV